MTTTHRHVRTVRLALVALATAAVAACGNVPTAPTTTGTPAAAPGDAPSRASGYMLSSGRTSK